MPTEEVFIPIKVRCTVGGIEANVLVSARNGEESDNVYSFVTEPCPGCQRWTRKKVVEVEEDIKREWGDNPRVTGIRHGRVDMLNQHLVNQARFIQGVKPELVVASCSPISIGRDL